MKSVWKYKLPLEEEFTLELSPGAEPLTVQVQGEQICLWALVDPAAAPVATAFRLAGTGHPLDESARWAYIGTCQLAVGAGSVVLHLFWGPAQPAPYPFLDSARA